MAKVKLRLDILENLQNEHTINDSKLAAELYISRATLWRIKTGKTPPGETFIAGVMSFFNVPFDRIFFLDTPLQECNKI